MGGCISEPPVEECCWGKVCFPCYAQFWGSDKQIFYGEVAMVVSSAILFIITIYNLFLFYFEAQRYCEYSNNNPDRSIAAVVSKNEIELQSISIDDKKNSDNPDGGNETKSDNKTYNISINNDKKSKYVPFPWMRLIHIGYPFVTGWFGIFRAIFLLSKPLLIGAALHNLFEWFMMGYAFFAYPRAREIANIFSMLFIWLVVVLVIGIVTFPEYGLLEQVSGIALDFALPIVWTILYTQVKKDDPLYLKKREMWRIAMIAHYTHLFGTIIPLVIGNFTVYQNQAFSQFLETIILFTVSLTHILYTKFATMYQELITTQPIIRGDDTVQVAPGCIKTCDKDPKCCDIPCKGRSLFCFWYLIALVIGLIPTTIAPALVTAANNGKVYNRVTGKCDATPPDPNDPNWSESMTKVMNTTMIPTMFPSMAPTMAPIEFNDIGVCKDESTYYGTSLGIVKNGLAEDFKRLVLSDEGYGLISAARAWPGNVQYTVVQDQADPNTFRWFEIWANFSSVLAWATQGTGPFVFAQNIVNNFFVDGFLTIYSNPLGMRTVYPCGATETNLTAGFIFNVNSPCNSIWVDLIDTNGCAWIKNCTQVSNVNVDQNNIVTRTVTLADSSTYQQTITLMSDQLLQFEYKQENDALESIIALSNGTPNTTCDVKWTFNAVSTYATNTVEFYTILNQDNVDYFKSIY